MGSRAYLQGTPWHEQKAKRSCDYGSKYCVYNKKICRCVTSTFYNKQCVGNGRCANFEPKTGTPKSYNRKTMYSIVEPENIKEKAKMRDSQSEKAAKDQTKEEKFLRLSEKRVNSIVTNIWSLAKLSNKSNYIYTDEQVDKIFSYIEKNLQEAKNEFKEKEETIEKFSW